VGAVKDVTATIKAEVSTWRWSILYLPFQENGLPLSRITALLDGRFDLVQVLGDHARDPRGAIPADGGWPLASVTADDLKRQERHSPGERDNPRNRYSG
jgi:hypothetical protein